MDLNGNENTNCHRTKKLLENFAKRNTLVQLIKTGTRKGKTLYSLIDHIYTSCPDKIFTSGKINYGMSDHNIIFVTIKKNIPKKEKITFRCRSLKNYDPSYINEFLTLKDWTYYYNEKNPEILWQSLYEIYLEGVNKFAPEIELNCKEKDTWVSDELLELIRDRDKYKSHADATNDNDSITEFKNKRGQCKRRVIRDKRDFIQNNLKISEEDPKKYWEKINELFPQGKKASKNAKLNQITLTNDKDEEIESTETANFINKFFTLIGPNLSKKINTDNTNYISSCKNLKGENIMTEWIKIQDIEVIEIVKQLNIHKGSNIRDINSKLLKDCLMASINEITHLFNMVSNSCIIPDSWKEATVVPIFKGGDKSKVSNYRPISLLPVISKLYEKLIHKRIYQFLQANSFFTERQCGFRPGMGTNDSINNFLTYVYESLNNNLNVLAIYYDLTKAFDTINHTVLLSKLEGAGIRGLCLQLIKNYLSSRKQRCKVNNMISQYDDITCGVPQGSTLGPLLFIIYINDIVNYVTNVEVSLYADDTACYIRGNDPKRTACEMKKSANAFKAWCDNNRLTINLNKSKTMFFSSHPRKNSTELKQKIKIEIDNTEITNVTEYKYLGLIINEHLNFDSHIKMIKQKISFRLYTLRKIRWLLSEQNSLLIFRSMLLPYFDVGDIYYNAANNELLKGLQSLQNQALKLISGRKNWAGSEQAHNKYNLLTTSKRRIYNLVKNGHMMSYTRCNLKPHNTRSLRSNRKILLLEQKAKNKKVEKSFLFKSRKMWNLIPEELKKIRDWSAFKLKLKLEMKLNNINFPE